MFRFVPFSYLFVPFCSLFTPFCSLLVPSAYQTLRAEQLSVGVGVIHFSKSAWDNCESCPSIKG